MLSLPRNPLKCPRCDANHSPGRFGSCCFSVAFRFLFFYVFLTIIIPAASFGIGIAFGLILQTIFGFSSFLWDLPLPSVICAPLFSSVASLIVAFLILRRLRIKRKMYGDLCCSVILADLCWAPSNAKAFCCSNCRTEFLAEFHMRKAEREAVWRERLEKKRANRLEKKKERDDMRSSMPTGEEGQMHESSGASGVVPMAIPVTVPVAVPVEVPQPDGGFLGQTFVAGPPVVPLPYMQQPSAPPSSLFPSIPVMQEVTEHKDFENLSVPPFGYPPLEISDIEIPSPVHKSQCCICLSNRSNVLYFPCKHCSQCDECPLPVLGSGRCPMCRAVVQKVEKIFVT